MNGLPYYKAYPRDFFEGTAGMPVELKGIYRLILDMIYLQGGALVDDPRYIAGHLGCAVRTWTTARAKLVEAGKIYVSGGLVRNYRADKEQLITISFLDKQRINGSAPKKNKNLPEAVAKPNVSHTEPEPDTEREEERESARKRAPPKRASSLPENWVPSDRNLSDASDRNFTAQETENEANRFRDYHLAHGSTFKDWDAAWRTWLGNARKFAPRGMAGAAQAGGRGQGSSIASIAARRHLGG